MSQAEDLLNSLSGTVIDHKHVVPDSDTYFLIDPYTRQIENTTYQKTVLMRGDHNSERFTFEVPRYVDGHDMSLCNRVIVHFDNVGDSIENIYSDVAYMEDLRINPDNPETVISSWLIRREATQIVGILSFSIQYQCVEGDTITYEWNTDSYDEIEIRKSKQNGEAAVIEYTNVLEQWRSQIFGAGDSVMSNITTEGANQVTAVQTESATQQAAIELKGSETLATIPEDYTEVYNMASEAVRTKADGVVCEAEGDVITVADASDDYIRGLNVYGKSTQFTTTGKNLFTFDEPPRVNSISFDESTQKVTVAAGELAVVQHMHRFDTPVPAGTTVTVTAWFDSGLTGSNSSLAIGGYHEAETGSTWQGHFVIDSNTNAAGTTKTATFVTTDTVTSIVFFANAGSTLLEDFVFKLQFEIGDTSTEYEPYTGGVAAPNPEYPQEIVNVENPIVSVYGSNLLTDYTGYKMTQRGITCEFEGDGVYHIYGTYNGTNPSLQFVDIALNIPVDPDAKYTMSCELVDGIPPDDFHPYLGLKSDTVSHRNWMALSVDSTKRVGDIITSTMTPAGTLNNPTHINRFWIYAHNDTLESYTADFRIRVWLTKSDTPMPYEPYNRQKLTIADTLRGVPVTSGGNYIDDNGKQWVCDEVDLERGVYIQRLGEKVLNGAETYSDYIAKDGIASVPLTHKPSSPAFCTHGNQGTEFNWANDSYVLFRVSHFNATTMDEFKAYIVEQYNAGIPITIQYILATPIETSLTAEEIETYKSLRTNYPNTTVLNNAGAWMKVKYNADTKLYISNTVETGVVNVVEGVLNDTY